MGMLAAIALFVVLILVITAIGAFIDAKTAGIAGAILATALTGALLAGWINANEEKSQRELNQQSNQRMFERNQEMWEDYRQP